MTDRVGQVWMARIGVETFPFVVLESNGTTWLVQNLTRVGESEWLGTIKSSQFGIQEGVFEEFERRSEDKGLQKGELFHFSGVTNILRERIA